MPSLNESTVDEEEDEDDVDDVVRLDEDDEERKEGDADKQKTADKIIQWIDGFPVPRCGFIPEKFLEVLQMEFRPTDIVLSTFPKCGTTWTQYIIWEIIHDGAPPPNVNIVMLKEFPFLELMGVESLEDREDPRMMKLHLPYDMTPKGSTKYVHILRNPFDVSVSLWSHLCEIDVRGYDNLELPFDEFFDAFLDGRVMFGDYFEHEVGWFEHKDDSNVLFLTYESMKQDPETAILRVADFLGKGQEIRENEQVLEDVLKHTSFDYLRDNCRLRLGKDQNAINHMGGEYPKYITDSNVLRDDSLFRTINFFRKGKVGSSVDMLSEDQWRRLEEAIQERVLDPELREMMLIARPPQQNENSKFCLIL